MLTKLKSLIWQHQLIFLLGLASLLFFFRIWTNQIFFTDEFLIEDIAYAMNQGENWLIPKLKGETYLVAPPLIYWQTAILYYFLPPLHVVVRIWMALYGLGLIFIIYRLGTLWYGKKVGFWGSLFIATSLPFIYYTKAANYDLPNAFFTAISIYFYNLAKNGNFKFLILSAVTISLGLLERSLLGLVPILIIGVDQFFTKKKISASSLLLCCLIIIFLAGSWNLAAYLSEPEVYIYHNYVVVFQQHVFSTVHGDIVTEKLFGFAPIYWFPPTIFLLFFGYYYAFKSKKDAFIQLFAWIISLWAVLAFSETKHSRYLLTLFPALAIASGCIVSEILAKINTKSLTYFLTISAIIIFTTIGPISLVIDDIPQSDAITGTEYIKDHSFGPIYFWSLKLTAVTRFYPGREVVIVDNQNLQQALDNNMRFLLIRNQDLGSIPKDLEYQTPFVSPDFTVLQF